MLAPGLAQPSAPCAWGAFAHRATAVRVNITASYGGAPGAVAMRVHAPCGTGGLESVRKLGTEDVGMTETTPVVWRGALYRFESVRGGGRLGPLPSPGRVSLSSGKRAEPRTPLPA